MGLFSANKEPKLVKKIKNGDFIDLGPSFGAHVITSMGNTNHGSAKTITFNGNSFFIQMYIFDLEKREKFEFSFTNLNDVILPESNVFAWDGFSDHYNARLAYAKGFMHDIIFIDIEQPSYFRRVIVPFGRYR